MGYQDRDYYREEDEQPKGVHFSGQRTMVINLVLLNVLVFVLDAFGPVRSWELVEKVDGRESSKVVAEGDEEVASWTKPNQTKYVSTRWLSGPMSLNSDLFASPSSFLANSWQLLAAGFAHSPLGGRLSFTHLAMNMLALWIFGRDLENKLGKWEFLRFYLAALLAVGLIWASIHHFIIREPASMFGASGAVTAVVMGFVWSFPTRRLSLLFGGATIPAWVVGVIYVGLDILGATTRWDRVAYEAHLAGAAFGLSYSWLGINFGRLWPRRWTVSSEFLRPKPQLRVHDPDPEETYRDLDEQADHILDKLHREGEGSLSRQERRILEDYSRRMRQKHR